MDSKQQEKFNRHVLRIDNLDRGQKGVLEHIDELYQLFPDKDGLTPQELKAYIQKKNPVKDTSYTSAIIDSSMDQEIGPEITQTLLEVLVERHMATKVMAVCSPIVSNQVSGKFHEVLEVYEEYEDLIQLNSRADSLIDCDMTFQDAISYRAQDSGIKWPISVLNRCIGGVEPSLGVVIARPDTGKTSFILNCLAYWATQVAGTGRQLLYCGNEEGIIGLKARFGVSLLGWETEEAEKRASDFGRLVSQKGGDAVRFHGGIRSTRDVETLIKRYEPLVVVADQIGKFKIPGRDTEGPAGLAEVYGWFRGKSQEYNTMVVGAAQADIKGHDIEWLNMNHINASKTDVPGELDWGIGIGMLYKAGLEFTRFINVFKNKMKYGRKGQSQVTFNPERCRYKG